MTAFLPYELAIEFLRRPQIQLAPYLTLERVERALASSGAGLDHLAGERPLALGEDSDGQFTNFFLLTDRRLAGRNDAHFRQAHAFQIEHTAITGVAYEPGFRKLDQQSDHVTLPSLRIFAGDTIVDATIPAFIEPLGQYVAAISQIVAEDRSPSIRPPTAPTDDDPTGAEGASRTLQAWSPRCSRMLQLISNGVRRRLLPLETGRDLAARVVLLYRTMVFGRGMTNGWWLSPLSAGDLRYAILMVMGRPVQEFQRDEIYCAYFEVGGGGGASKAAASSAAGLAALALFGAGWVSVPRRTKQTIRVAITGAPSHSTFNLSLVAGPRLFSLSSMNPEMLRSIWSALVQHEDQLMFMRCAFGIDNLTYALRDQLIFPILEKAIFAVAFWAGLRLTAGKDLSAERKETRLAKGFYLGTVITAICVPLVALASVLASMISTSWWSRWYMSSLILLIGLVSVIALFGEIVFLVLTYRMWGAIQDGHARTKPGAAVGLLFVPFFNLYWIFQAYRGFAEDFNSFCARHSINPPLLPTGLFTAYGALLICGIIPFIGWPLIVVNFFVALAMISKICDDVNSIPEKLPDQEAGGTAFQALRSGI